jgi:hypothetical protein
MPQTKEPLSRSVVAEYTEQRNKEGEGSREEAQKTQKSNRE